MNFALTLFASSFLCLSASAGSAAHTPPLRHRTERETAKPSVDSLQVRAAARTAYLADALQLSYAKARMLHQHTYAQLAALDSLRYAVTVHPAGHSLVPAITARYHLALARTLTPRQLETLLRLGFCQGTGEAAAMLASASRPHK